MITQNILQGFPVNEPIANFNQIFNNSCVAVCLDFLVFQGHDGHEFQNTWNANRAQYTNNALQNLNQNPAPDAQEVQIFLARDFRVPGVNFQFMLAPIGLPPEQQQQQLNQARQNLNACSVFLGIGPIGGHATLFFRNWQRLFIPGRNEGIGSRVFEYDGAVELALADNGNFLLFGEPIGFLMTVNL